MSEEIPSQPVENSQQPENAPAQPAAEETKPQLPEFGCAVEDAGTLKKKITITIPRQRIDAKMDEMYGELSRTAMVPGFRVGHAPRRLVEKRFGTDVGKDVAQALIGEGLQASLEKIKINVLGEPNIDLEQLKLPDSGDMTFGFEIEVAPDFELPELVGIEVKKPQIKATEERIDQLLAEWRQGRATYEKADQPAADGDVVIADTKISGADIHAHEHADVTLRVAPGQVEGIPLVELGTVLTGKTAGQSVSLTVTVPSAHPNEAWREKEMTVEIQIKEVRARKLPEMNEEFAKGMGYESLAEFRTDLGRRMEQRMAVEAVQIQHRQIEEYLLKQVNVELPAEAAKRHAYSVLQRRYVDLLQRGVPKERIDENLTQLQAAAEQESQRNLKLSFIIGKIAEKEGIKVEEGEVNSRIASMAAQYNRRPERMRQEMQQEGTLPMVEDGIRDEKVLNKLLEQAKITEVTAEELAAAEKAAMAPAEEKKE